MTAGDRPKPGRFAIHHLVPWFIVGFLTLAGVRSAGLIPEAALGPISSIATVLTVLSMAALGLGVDVRVVARAGMRVVLAVTASLLALGAVSLALQLHHRANSESMGNHGSKVHGWRWHRSRRRWSYGFPAFGR